MKIKFMQKVKIDCILRKDHGDDVRTWVEDTSKSFERKGFFLGYRTLANIKFTQHHHISEWDEMEYQRHEISEYIRVALVIFSDKENPVYVPLTAITVL